VVVKHNLDIIAGADWIVDLGPEGGDNGGRIVAEGAPEKVTTRKKGSHTAKILAKFLKERRSPAKQPETATERVVKPRQSL